MVIIYLNFSFLSGQFTNAYTELNLQTQTLWSSKEINFLLDCSHRCSRSACPNECGQPKGRGFCHPETRLCQCVRGFGGLDCSRSLDPCGGEAEFRDVDLMETPHSPLPRFGGSLLADRRGKFDLRRFTHLYFVQLEISKIRLYCTGKSTYCIVIFNFYNVFQKANKNHLFKLRL